MKNLKKLLFTIVFLGVFLITPFFVSAATIEELQAQIAALLKQISQLQVQIAQIQGQTTAVWCHDFNVNLKIGDSGDDVEALEYILVKEGFSVTEHSSNFPAVYDEKMAAAVSGFQQKYKDEILTPLGLKYGTGYVGQATRAKLNKLYGCKATTPSITVLSPNGGEAWQRGTTQTIKWSSSNVSKVNIYSTCNTTGVSLGYYVVASNVNSGSASGYNWYIDPAVSLSSSCKVKIENAADPNVNDTNDDYFSIVAAGTPSITVLSPNGGETWTKGTTQTIKWQDNTPAPICPAGTTCLAVPRMYDINLATYSLPCPTGAYCAQSPSAIYKIAKNIPINYYSWTVGAIQGLYDGLAPEGSYTIQVCQSGTNICDSSDAAFSIVAAGTVVPTLNVSLDASTPASATLKPGQTGVTFAKIKVSAAANPVNNMNGIQVGSDSANASSFLTNFKVYDGATLLTSSTGDLVYNGSYYYRWLNVSGFSVPAYGSKVLSVVADVKSTAPSGSVRLGIAGWNFDSPGANVVPFGTAIYGNNMSIVAAPSITVLSPNGGEVWTKGSTQTIKWSQSGCNYVIPDLIGGLNFPPTQISFGKPALTGQFTWQIPTNVPDGNNYKIRLTCSKEPYVYTDIYDNSNAPFSIVAAGTTCTETDGGKNYPVKGTVTAGGVSKTDSCTYCTGACLPTQISCNVTCGAVVEYYCENNEIKSEEHVCGSGSTCSDGACVSTSTPSITVLSPNGGEVWDESNNANLLYSDTCSILHCESIQWSGGSGTDWRSVSAYLEQYTNGQFVTVGKIPAYGYGSIGWPVGIIVSTSCTGDSYPDLYNCTKSLVKPGQYYVRLVDKVTGATDRSDAAFSIVAASTSYPGFYMSTDKRSYSINDTVTLTLSRVDGKSDTYPVDLYAAKAGQSNMTLIQSGLPVGQNTVKNIILSNWSLFQRGGGGDYILNICAAGQYCPGPMVSNPNSNAVSFTLISPYISLISPTSAVSGQSITIYGTNLNGTKPSGIYVEFLQNGQVKGSIFGSTVMEQSNGLSLTFILSSIFVANTQPGTYQVRVRNDYGSSNTVDFTILTTPSITVLSPNGGEMWGIGKTYTISWKSSGLAADAKIFIQLSYIYTNSNIRYEGTLALTPVSNSGIYNWTIGQGDMFTVVPLGSLKPDQFLVRVGYSDPSTGKVVVEDYSDAAFSIVAAVTRSIQFSRIPQTSQTSPFVAGNQTIATFQFSPWSYFQGYNWTLKSKTTDTVTASTTNDADFLASWSDIAAQNLCNSNGYCPMTGTWEVSQFQCSTDANNIRKREEWVVANGIESNHNVFYFKCSNVTVLNAYTISGYVRNQNSQAISGAGIYATWSCPIGPAPNASAVSNSNGYYSLTLPDNWSSICNVSMSASKTGCTFSSPAVPLFPPQTATKDITGNCGSAAVNVSPLVLKDIENQLASIANAISQLMERMKELIAR